MKNIFSLGIVLFLSTSCIVNIYGQSSFVINGQELSGNSVNISSSMGQVAFRNVMEGYAAITEGVQQPYEITIVTALNEPLIQEFDISVYPNPTIDFLTINIKNNQTKGLSFMLFDELGKFIIQGMLDDVSGKIPMQTYRPAVYFLQLIKNDKTLNIFKIIKH